MYEQRSERTAETERSPRLVDVSTLPRSGVVPTWISRISWGSVFAAAFIVVALQLALTALSIWGNFGLGHLTSPGSAVTSATSIAVWTGVWAIIALLIGGAVASILSNSRSVADGFWHGAVTWGVSVAAMTVLSVFGVAGLLGFGVNSGAAIRAAAGLPSTAPIALTSASPATGTYAGYYLLFSAIGLITALVGGVGISIAMSGRRSAVMPSSVSSEEETTVRRAA